MARVLVLTLVFPPDGVSTARIIGDVAEDLQRRGHDVTVLTTTPHYNVDIEAQARHQLRPRWGRLLQTSTFGGMRVFHVLMPRKNRSPVLRVVSWLWFHAVSTAVGFFALPSRPEVVLAPSPPLTMGVGAWLLAARWRAPYIYNVQEIHPDILVSLGIIRPGLRFRFLQALERFVYRHAGMVTVLTPFAEQRLLDKGVPPERVCVVPNFVDTAAAPEPRPNAFSREHGLDNMFVVTYAGNFGPAQPIHLILDAARLLRCEPDIRVVLVGGGTDWMHVAREASEIANVHVLPYQPSRLMSAIYGTTDLALVPLAAGTGLDAVPSKVYEIMSYGLPLVAIVDDASDLARLVKAAGAGVVVPPCSAASLAAAVRDAAHDREKWRAMGRSGKDHVSQHYSRPNTAARYDALVRQLVAPRAPG